ncbi:ECF sigma factor [Stieleria maiorica]|uniref:ECF sigma factor n=1 Tax=Stieleria maiorica TaxID=2795974 RepID=A0A5B9M5F6_9BACT|nr:ECF-type sigma factor [Stieleria maiorica]QEF96252.1 ECF sigma factor [Stieleria maiorica]
MSDVTKILGRIDAGDGRATQELLPLVYDELRRLAAQRMRRERSDHTLQSTALVHDAYLRLVGSQNESCWQSRSHFFAAAAQAMRRILIEHARRKASLKRGGDWNRIALEDYEEQSVCDLSADQLLELDETLTKLEAEDAVIAELVRLRLYAGLSVTEAAGVMGISRSVAYQHWEYALAWFAVELEGD